MNFDHRRSCCSSSSSPVSAAPVPTGGRSVGCIDGSAAAAAGIQVGDRIVEVDGQPVGDFSDFASVVRPNAGSEIDVVVERDGQRIPILTKLGWELTASAAAALPGLEPGDRVTRVGDVPVASYAEMATVLAAASAGPVQLDVRS